MKSKLSTILNMLLIGLMTISTVLTVIFYFGTSLYSSDVAFSEQISILGWRLNIFINWAYILTLICAAVALIFPLVQMAMNPKGSKKSFLLIALVGLVFLISYLVASPELAKFPGYEAFFDAQDNSNPINTSKMIDAGLWATYLLFFLSVGAILWAEVNKLFK